MKEKEAAENLGRYSARNWDDVARIVGQEETLLERITGPLSAYFDDIVLLYQLVRDALNGAYPDVPWRTIACIAGALAYIISPIDAIPDFIPVFGLLDDVTVLGLALSVTRLDVAEYRAWRDARKVQEN